MSDVMWKDPHANIRGHSLMTEEIAQDIPTLNALDEISLSEMMSLSPHAKLFSPMGNWTWYIATMNPQTGLCFGLVDGIYLEWGLFDLGELAESIVAGIIPAVERDIDWQPKTYREIETEVKSRPTEAS